jgi:hypothetical protein
MKKDKDWLNYCEKRAEERAKNEKYFKKLSEKDKK